MLFSWSKLNYPLIICPPMDGITDMAYRELVAEMGGAGPLYCEFVNVKGLIYENPKTLFELRFTEKQNPTIVQLFGHEPEEFYEAAKIAINLGFPAIDVNMGCPAHKVASKGGGCALMGDTENARKIVEETIRGANEQFKIVKSLNQQSDNEKVSLSASQLVDLSGNNDLVGQADKQTSRQDDNPIEVSCKMRLGINDKELVYKHAPQMLEGGVKAIAIHGRTLKQMYTGEADWEPLLKMRKFIDENYRFEDSSLKPKLFGSGDVKSLYEAFLRILITGVDGVMIGRGSFGNPWVFEKKRVDLMKKYLLEIQNAFGKKSGEFIQEEIESYKGIEKIKTDLANHKPTFDELAEMAIHHAKIMEADKAQSGIVQMRKHLGWYFMGFDGAKELRNQLVRVNSVEEIENILSEFRKSSNFNLQSSI